MLFNQLSFMPRRIKGNKSMTTRTYKNDKLNIRYNKPYPVLFDRINTQIAEELLKNHNIKSSEVSVKLKVPLSTIQRRRSAIERSGLLQHKYEVDPKKFGLRSADLLVNVSKGDCEEITKKILNQYRKNILHVTIRIGSLKVNLVATVIYKDTDQVYEIMQYIRGMEYVESVEWSEIVKTVIKNDSDILKNIFE